ncbi:DUF481 domain-containing protein [candidate division KSB1 bacterium]|nr:DUF481 domain-containing protein [candidate division KSB1 bacterium]
MIKNIHLMSIVALLYFPSTVFAQVNTEKFRIDADSLGFSVRSNINFSIMMGNTDFQLAETATRFNYNWGKDYTFLVANGGYGRNEGTRFFRQTIVHLRNVNVLNHCIQLEEFLQYDTDDKRLLLQRTLVGGGFRFKIFKHDKYKLRIGTAAFFEQEEYNLEKDARHKANVATIRSSSYLTFNFALKKDLSLLSITYLQPDVAHVKDLRVLTDNALNIKLGKTVDLVLTAHFRYDSKPPDNIERIDLVSKIGVAINF